MHVSEGSIASGECGDKVSMHDACNFINIICKSTHMDHYKKVCITCTIFLKVHFASFSNHHSNKCDPVPLYEALHEKYQNLDF